MLTNPPLQPQIGFGLSLRREHSQDLMNGHPSVDWLEILSENYMVDGGKPLYLFGWRLPEQASYE